MARSSVELIVDAVKALNPLRAVAAASKKTEEAIESLKKSARATGKTLEDMGRKGKKGLSGLAARAKTAAGSFSKLGKAALLAGAAAGAAALAKFSFGAAGELERQTKSLKVLTGSLETAKGIIAELQAFGAVTPFTSQELIETSKRLKAFGFETNQVVDITKRLADVAGATGADLGGIATAFGQIQAKGRLQGEELLQLQERGVALQDELRKMYALTGEEFSKALQKGQISAKAAEIALIRLTEKGGKYANGAIAQSDTLFGKLSTLQDAFQRFGQNIGNALAPVFKSIIEFLTTITNQINNLFREAALENQARKNLGLDKMGSTRKFFKEGGRSLLDAEKERLREKGFGIEAPVIPDTTVPALTAGSGVRGTGAGKERVDMSVRMLELNRRLRSEQEAGNAREIATLQLMVRRQEIAESALLTAERQNALEEALFNFRQKIFDLDEKAKKEPMSMDFADLFKREQSKIEQFIESGKQSLQDLQQVAINVSQGIGDAIANALTSGIQGLIDGSAKVKDVFANLLSSVGQVLAQEGAKMISTYIAIGIAKAFAGLGGGKFDAAPLGAGFSTGATASGFDAVGAGLFSPMANGGPVRGGQPYMVGERGPELFVPGQGGGIMRNEDMRRMMGNSPAGNAGMSMNFSFETTSIGGTEYVSREQLEAAMATTRRQAASDGAKRGMNMTLDRMQNSPRTRTRVGIS
nr:tape measure domain [uncultured Mediterranean phage uvMED]BAR24949.1 tape measure domain [uncultured Mediterranean phage uvMED]BAR39252.1 tape measure domain [uncultured Mediterranean phage uvMED]